MHASFKLRLTALVIMILVLGTLIAWAANTTWRLASSLREKLTSVQIESFRIAEEFQASLMSINNALLRFESGRDPADLQSFRNESHKLDTWIDDEIPRLTTKHEQEVLTRINSVFDSYIQDAAPLLDQKRNPDVFLTQECLRKIEIDSKLLLALGSELAHSHREAMDSFLSTSNHSIALLQKVTFGSLLILLTLGSWITVMVYREMVAPLRAKIIENEFLIERQEKLASLGVLAAGVAHEIRNPLTAIKARLFTLEQSLGLSSVERNEVTFISQEISRLERIVNAILQFASPADPKRTPLSPSQLLKEVSILLAPELEKRSIAIKLDLQTDVSIQGDFEQLKQVLINLVKNASESITQRGRITLRSRTGVAKLRGTVKQLVFLEVEDTGKGIPPAVQKRLFDPFFTTKEKGTGLGLSISARIVEKHGGAMEYQTHLDHGAIFGIMLPANPSP